MESRKLFCNKFPKLKKWSGGLVIVTLAIILFFSYSLNGSANPKKHSAYDFFHSSPSSESDKDIQSPMQSKTPKKPHLVNLDGLDQLYGPHNISSQDSKALLVWPHMRSMLSRSDALPETAQGVKEASMAWKDLILTIEDKKVALMLSDKGKVKAEDEYCPFSVDEMKTISLLGEGMVVELPLPCGLVEDSSISLVGVPDGTHKYNTFQIKLLGSQLPGKEKAPIVLQYNVSLALAEEEEEPFIVQNTWTHQLGWGTHQKCPPHPSTNNPKVDGLVLCNKQAFRSSSEENQSRSGASNDTSRNVSKGIDHESAAFPFSEGIPFIATLWVGAEGFHMTVNGRHETSFAYREKLEPWLVSKVKVLGGLKLLSALAKGLPVSEDHDVVIDSQRLKAPSVSKKRLIMLIGVFSTGNNFERRMALRRSWMQYEAVRSGDVAVRFFVGLHKNKQVNYELWREAQAYGDIQLMPFVDYYTLISLKTIAICIMGTKILPSKYIMKTDDDAFVRIDEILSSLKVKPSDGLLYGLISFDSSPHRDKESKWYISDQEWPPAFYPPWAHGPGYVISRNIAKFIVRGHQQRDLKLFKLEDVAMGIWIEEFKKSGERVEYVTDERFHNAGCESNYILAHYQSPRLVLCLWENLQKQLNPICCD